MTDTVLREDLGNGVAVLTLNRPPVNAIIATFLNDFAARLADLEQDPAIRTVVIASSFKVFSAGLDLKQSKDFSVGDQTAIVDAFNSTFARLFGFPKPVVAAVSGAAIAGGLFFVLCADRAVTHKDAKFGLAEVRVGASFPIGPLEVARATLPPSALNRLMLTGQPVSAQRAMESGFIDEVVAESAIMESAVSAARDLATVPPKTYATIKAQIRGPALAIINNAIANQSDPVRSGWFSDETRSAMKATIG